LEKYDVPDEHLSYSELKDRIRAECAKNLAAKERILFNGKEIRAYDKPGLLDAKQLQKASLNFQRILQRAP
jgi:hypothetical protein